MNTERWRRIDELVKEGAEVAPARREDWLKRACGDDEALQREVASLLRFCDAPLEFLDSPALDERLAVTAEELLGEASLDPLVGQTIGRYELTRRIASGGTAAVYEAYWREEDFEHRIAIKILHSWIDPAELLRRFHIERQTLAHLNHPNIARFLDAGLTSGGVPYLMMEYIEGEPIDEYCDRRRLNITERLHLFQGVCRAVHFAHQNLVIHRDLKPSNILVTPDDTPKLLDFGIAKVLQREGRAITATMTRHHMLTPDYASPEQMSGDTVNIETDIYSLGVVLYELLTGTRPHHVTSTRPEEIERLRRQPPRRPSTALTSRTGSSREYLDAEALARSRGMTIDRLQRRLRGDLDTIVLMALRSEPSRRYASAIQFAEDLQRHLDAQPVVARKDTLRYRTAKFVGRNRLAVGAAAAVLAALLLGTITTGWQAQIARREADHAAWQAKRAADERDAAQLAEHRAEHEAEHATIEAESATEVANFLVDAFLISTPQQTPQELEAALDVLERQVIRVRRQYEQQPHLLANLLNALGDVYMHLRLYEEADALMQEAAAIRRASFGAETLEMARSLDSLGNLHYSRGQYEPAAQLFREALRLHRELPVGVHTDVAKAANNLAVVYRALGRTEEAEALHKEALALRRKRHGSNSLLVAESLNNLAGIAISRTEHEEAEGLLTEALSIRRAILGDNHPLVAQTINNLAVVLRYAGRSGDAESLMREATDIYRAAPDRNLEELARSLTNLAGMLLLQKRLEEAAPLLNESVELLRSRSGPDHPHLATALTTLAQLEQSRRRHDAALEHWEEALRIRRLTLPPDHPHVAIALGGYGAALIDAGRVEEAEPPLRQAVAISRSSLPGDHPHLATALINHGGALVRLGRLAEAEEALREAASVLSARASASPREQEALKAQLEVLRAAQQETEGAASDPAS